MEFHCIQRFPHQEVGIDELHPLNLSTPPLLLTLYLSLCIRLEVCVYPISISLYKVGGVRFLYDNVIESLVRFDSSPGFGCILAHSMGLGKTMQVSSLTYPLSLSLIPLNTLSLFPCPIKYSLSLPSSH